MSNMETFREVCLTFMWPLCILLWTIMAAISIWESLHKRRHVLKVMTRRLDSLERKARNTTKQISGKVKETHFFTEVKTGKPKLRITFASGAIYEIDYDAEQVPDTDSSTSSRSPTAEAPDSSPGQCRFESDREHIAG